MVRRRSALTAMFPLRVGGIVIVHRYNGNNLELSLTSDNKYSKHMILFANNYREFIVCAKPGVGGVDGDPV